MKRSIIFAACVTQTIGLVACGGDGPVAIASSGPSIGSPVVHVPTFIVAVTPAQQSTRPGTAVAQPPTVEVRDEAGTAMPNISISFRTSGGGSIGATQALTNSSGQASAGAWTVGNAVGPYFLTATIAGRTLSVEFTALALVPGKAGQLDLVAVAGQPLPLREQVDFEVFDLVGGRYRLAADGTFLWGYIWRDIVNGVPQPVDSLIDFGGAYVQRDSATIDFYFFANSGNLHVIPWKGIATVRGDTVKVQYVLPNATKQDETYIRR